MGKGMNWGAQRYAGRVTEEANPDLDRRERGLKGCFRDEPPALVKRYTREEIEALMRARSGQ